MGEDGLPATLVIHKMWLSKLFDREPMKKSRDKEQAIVVFRLINQYLPQYQFNRDELKMFPKSIVDQNFDEIRQEAGVW